MKERIQNFIDSMTTLGYKNVELTELSTGTYDLYFQSPVKKNSMVDLYFNPAGHFEVITSSSMWSIEQAEEFIKQLKRVTTEAKALNALFDEFIVKGRNFK
jgi:hypothetical protein